MNDMGAPVVESESSQYDAMQSTWCIVISILQPNFNSVVCVRVSEFMLMMCKKVDHLNIAILNSCSGMRFTEEEKTVNAFQISLHCAGVCVVLVSVCVIYVCMCVIYMCVCTICWYVCSVCSWCGVSVVSALVYVQKPMSASLYQNKVQRVSHNP